MSFVTDVSKGVSAAQTRARRALSVYARMDERAANHSAHLLTLRDEHALLVLSAPYVLELIPSLFYR